MAAAQILATASGAANSADQVVAAGTPLTVSLRAYDRDSIVIVELKDEAAAYTPVNSLTNGQPGLSISSPGTYRFRRPASSSSCGVFNG